jgi:hypothetical protein
MGSSEKYNQSCTWWNVLSNGGLPRPQIDNSQETMKKLFVLLALACAPTASAQQVPDSGSFFVRLGRDTIAVERYTVLKNQLVAEALLRTPVTRHLKLNVTFKEDGTLSWWEVINSPVPGTGDTGPVTRGLVTLVGDSASVEFKVGANSRPIRKVAAHPSMMPLQAPFYSTYELALRRHSKNAADTLLSMLAANVPLHYRISYPRPDSVILHHAQGGTTVIKTDGNGRILNFNGAATTFKVQATRSKPVDLAVWAKRFAKADSAGRAIGFLSPKDTVDFSIENGQLWIEYSRPAKRGRVIFGGIVPYDQVWRTGANQATAFEIELGTMIIGDVKIPKGKYTLWTLPSRTGWKLIINKQTGQWGTVYDPAQDLARIDVKTETVAVPVEQFTIEAKRTAVATGVLTLTWDRTRVVVPFRFEP